MCDESIKVVVVGDGAVGKTCMLISYSENRFPEEYVPSIFDNYAANVMWEDKVVSLGLWDTAGQSDYDRLRPLSYPETQCFLVVYSCVNPTSYENVASKWIPELRHYCPEVPIVLVATKLDMREDPAVLRKLTEKDQAPVTWEMGERLKKEIGAAGFVEVSAKTQKNLQLAFNHCIEAVLRPQRNEREKKQKKFLTKCLIC